MKLPKLDKMVRDRMSKGVIKLNYLVARPQALCMDAAGLLASLMDQVERTVEESVAIWLNFPYNSLGMPWSK